MAASSNPDIGRYRVLTELGQGGTANVYLAVASGIEGFNKLVVLKRMKSQLSAEPGFASMFLDEAKLAARLGHSNIVQTYEVFKDRDLPVIVMEYLEGQTLANIIAKSADKPGFELHHHLAIISEALSGLEYSHDLCDYDAQPLHVVHRDVTPHNVFVTFDGQVKVLDFGIAKLSGSLVETESGVIKGKLRYIPPEQMVNETVDRRADLYSVGVMLWEAASGEKMWRGLSEATVMNRVINGEIPEPSEVNPHVAPGLERIVMKALSPDREDRHATARALQQELDALRATLPHSASGRELGPLLEKLFDTERADRRRTIESQLSDERLTHSTPAKAAEETTPPSYALSESPTRRSLRAGAITLASVGTLALVTFLLWPRELPTPVAPAPSATLVEGPSNVKPTYELRVIASPPEASIAIDGAWSKENPTFRIVEGDDALHEVRAEAQGYEGVTETLRFDRSRSVVLRLSRGPEPKLADTVAPAVPSTRPGSFLPAKGQDRACEPPFAIDARGIKRFKPECVK